MNVYKNKQFWTWLFCNEAHSLPDSLFTKLKKQGVYKKETKTSVFEGKPYDWTFETLLLNFPTATDFSFSLLFLTEEQKAPEEDLFLTYKNEHYVLGWYDCHQHNHVFRATEFFKLAKKLKNAMSLEDYETLILVLSKYITLTNEEEATTFAALIIEAYKSLLGLDKDIDFKITKNASYGQKIANTELLIKLKTINILNTSFSYLINEGVAWKEQKNKQWHLEGFAAHSTRGKCYENALTAPFPIYNVNADRCNYKFPYELWEELIN